MAGIIKRIWRSGPRRVKRVAWGYTLQLNGKQERRFNVAWSKDDARDALAARILERDKRREPPPDTITLGMMAEKYLLHKEAARKRSIRNDRMALARLTSALGAETALADVTAARIAEYSAKRLTETSKRLGRPVAPASVNRDLSVLRGLLRLAKRWRYLTEVPEVEMAREPEGRLRFLSEEEAVRLLDECRKAGEHRVSSCGRVPSRVENRNGAFFRLDGKSNHQPAARQGGRRRNAPWRRVSGSRSGCLRIGRPRWAS